MSIGRRVWFVGVLMTLLAVGRAHAQTGTVTGRVTEKSGAPIAGAEVRVDSTQIHTSTDGDGRYTLADVTAGRVTVRALMLGYKSLAHAATVEAGATATVDFQLEESVIPTSGVEVVVGSRAK